MKKPKQIQELRFSCYPNLSGCEKRTFLPYLQESRVGIV